MGTIKSGTLERLSMIRKRKVFRKRILNDLNLLSIIEMNVFDFFLQKLRLMIIDKISKKVSSRKEENLMDLLFKDFVYKSYWKKKYTYILEYISIFKVWNS